MQIAGLALLALTAQIAAPAPPAESGAAAVDGIVVDARSGQPLSGAKVQLFRPLLQNRPNREDRVPLPGADPPDLDDDTPYSATTRQDGRFVFDNVKPGEYRLVAAHAGGYVPAEYGQRSPRGAGISFPVAAGQKVQGVQLVLTPTGAISGRVYDRDGPAGKLQIQALKPVYRDGQRTLTIVQSVQTNDRGEYRLFWLPPARYYITARPFDDAAFPATHINEPSRSGTFEQASNPVVTSRTLPSGEIVEETQLPVYYPGTTEIASAVPVDLAGGANAEAVDILITTPPVRTRHVRGIVVANGEPTAAAISAVPRIPGPAPLIANGRAAADGAFDVTGVAPGAYFLMARTNAGLTGALTIQISDADIDSLVIPVSKGVRLTGRFRIDGQARNGADPEFTNLRLTLRRDPDVVGMPLVGPSFNPPPSADGTFVIDGVAPGDFQTAVRGLPENAYVRSIRMGGVDVLDAGLHLTGTPREPLEIVISPNAGTLSGTVVSTRQQPLRNATVAAVPSAAGDRHRADLYATAVTDTDGHFRMDAVPEGNYAVFAWESVEDGAWRDADFVRAYESRGTSVRVRDGVDQTVQLTVLDSR